MSTKNTSEYKNISAEETIDLLKTSANGLTESEAKTRLDKFGFNEVKEKEKNPIIDLLSRYWGPMPWLLEFAIVLSYLLGHYLEVGIIFVLLSINVVIGFRHSLSSKKALELLKKRLAINAKVLRNDEWLIKDAKEIVPGDIISIRGGDLVPADAKILSDGEISVDQSSLTGESLPVAIDQSGIIYSSSIVKKGEARAIVINTGINTYFGKTVQLVKIAKPTSHQEQIMLTVVKYMVYVSIGALLLIVAGIAITHLDIFSIATYALIFLMGAIPVALPAVFAVVLAVGAIELSKKGALVTRLNSIEDAASMQILCLDKTGTITQNKISVIDPVSFSQYKKEDVILMACLASKEESGDAIDLAVFEYAKATEMSLNSYKQISSTPFDPAIKRSEALVESNRKVFRVVKGAPQIILSLCKKADGDIIAGVNKKVEELSLKGYRTLAVAKSEVDDLDNLQLVGLLPLADPPRADSKKIIEELKGMGVKLKMLTGDNIAIAKEIASQVSIGNDIRKISELKGLNDSEEARILEKIDGIAEIYPEDKYRIVKLLQSQGYIVGMTGDGVNDSPALKQAEVGIAVSNSTDVAKASSSIILTEKGLEVINDTIKTSREIYQRMLTWVINKVTKVIQFIGLLTVGFLWLHDLLLSLLGMVLLIFANDFMTMSLATDNVKHTTNPNVWNVKNITLVSLVIGVFLVLEGIIAVFIGINYFHLDLVELQTFVMLMLIFTSQFRVLIVRERVGSGTLSRVKSFLFQLYLQSSFFHF